ncbi:unnamed protein product, partial [Effrenium voratum]
KYAKDANVRLTGYGTGVVVETAAAEKVAQRLGRSAGQVLLRWAVQKNIAVNPKSNKVERLRENLDVLNFKLDDSDMKILDALEENRIFYWNTSCLVPSVRA